MKVSAALPTGVAALFFESAQQRRQLEGRLTGALEAAGFAEVCLPVVDYLDPYETLPSAVRRDELYRFVDRDGAVLALRADFTPMLARLIAPRLTSMALPLRLFYRGDVLRYQEEQAGRARELYQVGAETLGVEGEAAEAEVLERFLSLLVAAGCRSPRVVLGLAGALDALLLTAGGESGSPSALAAAVVRRDRRLARRGGPALRAVVERGLPDDPADLGAAAVRLERLLALRARLAEAFPTIELVIDLAEFADQAVHDDLRRAVGARAYYDGLVFRAFGGRAGQALGGGGRYDRLFAQLGAPVTATGFSFSLERLLAAGEGVS